MPKQELVEEGILVSPRMMADHMPDYLTAVLRRMAHKRGPPFFGEAPNAADGSDAADVAADRDGSGSSGRGTPPEPAARASWSGSWAVRRTTATRGRTACRA